MTEEAKKRILNQAAEMRTRCEEEISRMKEEATEIEQHEQNKKSAALLYDIYQSHIEAGFTEEQAWELTKLLIVKSK